MACARLEIPLCYNGDVFTAGGAADVMRRFPATHALMLGRGLMADPALARQIRGGGPAGRSELHEFHDAVYAGCARDFGNENVTVRYFAGNHQMRAGEGLFTPNLPLAEGYTQALENWVNGVTAGTKADGWATPQVAGATPHQRFAAPQRTRSGIVGSLGVLAGLMVAGPVLIVMAAILGIGLTVFSWLQTLLAGRRSVATVRAMHATPSGRGAAQQRTLHGIAGLSAGIGTAVMVITGLLYGYMSAVGVSAVLVMPQPRLFAVGWVVLRIATMLLVVLFAWEMERVWYCRADIVGVRRVICVMVALGTLATLMTLAFWGLFSL